jgi:hypothetical protein
MAQKNNKNNKRQFSGRKMKILKKARISLSFYPYE